MSKKRIERIIRPATPEERARHTELRKQAEREFPPLKPPRIQAAAEGIGARVAAARQAQGLTWYKVAKLAGIPNSNTVRDIECGCDVKLSNLEAVAAVLGLKLELVEAH
jgi:hypothetical protein